MSIEFNATVERTTFKSQDGAFAIVRANDPLHGAITICGELPPFAEGSTLVGEGEWEEHPKFGRQLKPKQCKVSLPTNKKGILQYLQSGLIAGVGPKMAQRIYDHFGESSLDIIKNHPEKMAEVPGIGKKRADSLAESARDAREVEAIMTWLMAHNINTGIAMRIYRAYGNSAMIKLNENPWILAEEVFGIGFKTADMVAKKLGINPNSRLRLCAGLKFNVSEADKQGNTGIYREELINDTVKLLNLNAPAEIDAELLALVTSEELESNIREGRHHFIQLGYVKGMEESIARRIKSINRTQPNWDIKKAVDSIPAAERMLKITLSDDQRAAVTTILSNKVAMLIGKPGCGKTTVLNVILTAISFAEKNPIIRLAAPTGKAAQRMAESTDRKASTIHRLLEWSASGPEKNKDDPLKADYLAFDEVSMLDTRLAHHLLSAVEDETGVILVGDEFQLSSVGSGAVLADLRDSGHIAVAELTQIHRQAAESHIITNAHKVNAGDYQGLRNGADFEFLMADNSADAVEIIKKQITTHLPSKGFAPRNVQVLTAGHRAVTGTIELNESLRAMLNPSPPDKITYGKLTLGIGDRVLVTRNNYDLEVFNGQSGVIERINDGVTTINIEGSLIEFEKADLKDVQLAYAMTVHKSQGSQFPAVIMVVDTAHYTLLQRNWLYTGITRAQSYCTVVFVGKALGLAVRTTNARERLTRLKDCFKATTTADYQPPEPKAAEPEAINEFKPFVPPAPYVEDNNEPPWD